MARPPRTGSADPIGGHSDFRASRLQHGAEEAYSIADFNRCVEPLLQRVKCLERWVIMVLVTNALLVAWVVELLSR